MSEALAPVFSLDVETSSVDDAPHADGLDTVQAGYV